MRRIPTLGIALLFAVAFPTAGLAQDAEPTPIVLGERTAIHSTILGEERPVLIHTPNGYEQSSDPYPVLYLLDGDTHLLHTAGIIEFLSSVGNMSPMIVVALPNTDRTRDLTPPYTPPDTGQEPFPTAGGADNFLTFLTEELMPHIEDHYRTAPYKVLVGHSFGGLFAIHALMTRPEAFNAYVAISPSLWWDDKGLIPKAAEFFQQHDSLDRYLYVTTGSEGGAMLSSTWEFAGILEEHAPDDFRWHFEYMPAETHGSIPHRTTYDALEHLYADWAVADITAVFESGTLDALDAHYARLSEQFGYPIRTPEARVNSMGYFLLGQERVDEAIAVFERNVEVYPESANVYDSLGDAYDAAGRFADAKASYEKGCAMGRAVDHVNTTVYCDNYERLVAKADNR